LPHSIQSHGFASAEGREAKAEKILEILGQSGHPIRADQRILDIGTGSGHIAMRLSRAGLVVACDVVDQRVVGHHLPFARVGDSLPFRSESVDLVISNHVIEHVPDPEKHLREIRRVLRAGGVAYLATPNRWWPWEAHTHLPFLHYLPAEVFSRVARGLHRSSEPIHLQSLAALRRRARGLFVVTPWHQEVLKQPDRYSLQLPSWARLISGLLPNWFVEVSAPFQPTLICVLLAK